MIIEDEFLAELRKEFLGEATGLLENWEELFLKLEEAEDKKGCLADIFRVAHSLKGTSSAIGYQDIATFTHHVEDVLSNLKADPEKLTPEMTSMLLKCGDALKSKVAFLHGSSPDDWAIDQLSGEIEAVLGSWNQQVVPQARPEPWKNMLDKMNDGLGIQLTEEHLELSDDEIIKIAHEQKKEKQSAVKNTPMAATIKIDAYKIDKVMNLIGELVINKSQLAGRIEQHKDDPFLESTYALLEKTIRELQEETLGIRMISLKNLFLKCQRAIRDVALKLDKDIEFVSVGEDVEIDRSMVEQLTDPLMHILRNAADHGIESNEERAAAGKEKGRITLKAEHLGSKITIQISDTGKGISKERVFEKARQNGLVPGDARAQDFSDHEVFQFIMMPGFSTAEKVTDVSGRGVGLDVVKTTIEKLSGRIEISSVPGEGSKFKLMLPMTTSILEGLHVMASGCSYIFPTDKVVEIIDGKKLSFTQDPSNSLLFDYRKKIIPFSTLNHCLGKKNEASASKIVLIIESEGENYGVGVDEFISQVHVVLKPINNILKTSDGISSSCILSHGGVGLVIDTDNVCRNTALSLQKGLKSA